MSANPWISIRNRSQYSILQSTLQISKLVAIAKEQAMPAVGMTDFCNMFGVVEFYKECKANNIKPLVGCEIVVAIDELTDKHKVSRSLAGHPILLLVKDLKGYKNLCKLISIAYSEGFYYTPRIDKKLLKKHSQGLICLSGDHRGPIASLLLQDKAKQLDQEVQFYHELFGDDFYFEVQSNVMSKEQQNAAFREESWLLHEYESLIEKQQKMTDGLRQLSMKYGVKLVATNATCYAKQDQWAAQEVLMNVQSGEPCDIWETDAYGNRTRKVKNPKRAVLPSKAYHFPAKEEIQQRFKGLEEAIAETDRIAQKCSLEFDFSEKFYPVFVPPELENRQYTDQERDQASKDYLRRLCEEGILKRYNEETLGYVKAKYPDSDPMDVVKKRLAYEIGIITSKGMCDYLLIVHDFIAWAKQKKIPVGPGRGSGAGSIILFLIGITDIEPLRFGLIFERFINPERLSYPDIDVDICMDRRSEVIEYTLDKYGRDRVAQIITFGTMKAKMAVKDVGRVLNVPLSKVNTVAKLIPDDLSMTLEKALDVEPELKQLYDDDEEVKTTIDYALQLEGSVRNTGIHAAGIIISGDPLTEHIPVCTSKDTDIFVTQYSMKPVEQVGMLKIDFLGLKTLTSIQKTVDAIKQSTGKEIDWCNLALDDKNTFDLLNQGKTQGVFQLESAGMQDLAKKLHIDRFEEIIAVGALYRPGPMQMIPSFISRKHGREDIEIDHPWMKDILQETYGIIVYQEQVIQIASTLAGYSLGEGDVLRKAMGKKDREEMARQEEKFRKGAVAKGIDEKLATEIFNKVEKFASYGFNKSHATAYGYLSYATAYFKSNYPKEWFAALMSCDIIDLAKVSKHIRECQSTGIEVLPPDINESSLVFVATDRGVRFALTAIKGVGEGVVEAILEARRDQPFTSFYDFLEKIDTTKVGKKVVQSLIESGSFDLLHPMQRAALLTALDREYEGFVRKRKEAARGLMDLFSEESVITLPAIETISVAPLSKLEMLAKEKELLGFYITGHPLNECQEQLKAFGCDDLIKEDSKKDLYAVKAALLVDQVQVKISGKTGKKYAIVTLNDTQNQFETMMWSEMYQQNSDLVVENRLLAAVCVVDTRNEIRIQMKWMADLTTLDDKQVQEGLRAFEQAQKHVKFDKRKKPQALSKQNAPLKILSISANHDSMHLSHILALKRLLMDHPGPDKVRLAFCNGSQEKAWIEIDQGLTVKGEEKLLQALQNLAFVSSCTLSEVN